MTYLKYLSFTLFLLATLQDVAAKQNTEDISDESSSSVPHSLPASHPPLPLPPPQDLTSTTGNACTLAVPAAASDAADSDGLDELLAQQDYPSAFRLLRAQTDILNEDIVHFLLQSNNYDMDRWNQLSLARQAEIIVRITRHLSLPAAVLESQDPNPGGESSAELEGFMTLPPELREGVYRWAPHSSLVSARLVCRGFRDGIDGFILRKVRHVTLPLFTIFFTSRPTQDQFTLPVVKAMYRLLQRTRVIQQLENTQLFAQHFLRGNSAALWKVVKLGTSKQNPSPEELRCSMYWNDILVAREFFPAIDRKYYDLDEGRFGYEKNEDALRTFIEERAALGDRRALSRKTDGLKDGKYGYKKDWRTLHTWIEEQVALGNEWAIKEKSDRLSEGTYGYERDVKASAALNELLVSLGNRDAILLKTTALNVNLYTGMFAGTLDSRGFGIRGYTPDEKTLALYHEEIKQETKKFWCTSELITLLRAESFLRSGMYEHFRKGMTFEAAAIIEIDAIDDLVGLISYLRDDERSALTALDPKTLVTRFFE